MNYYILLINIVLMLAIFFTITSISTIVRIISKELYTLKSGDMTSIYLFTAFFWALYNYLIMTQI